MLKYFIALFILLSCSKPQEKLKPVCGTPEHRISKCYIIEGQTERLDACFCRYKKDGIFYSMRCRYVKKKCVISVYFAGE